MTNLKMKEGYCSKSPNVYGMYIKRLANRIKYLADDNLVKHNITLEQVKILRYLNMHGGDSGVCQRDIEEEFGIRRSSVTNILQNIERNGFIVREGDPCDARMKRVVLTDKGREKSRVLKGYIDNLETVIVYGMTAEEKTQFLDFLKRSLDNVERLL